ncbi:MAG: Flp pilus assembly protein CpaB [Deltaproteobacteria bacterium]|nr:Flp pilus assembly protein CpaB [Deltaproteobacteria bacterium]
MLKGKAPIVVALVFGLLAVLIAWRAIKLREEEVTAGWDLREVVVAAEDIQPGQRLTTDNLAKGQMPSKFVYDSVLLPDDLEVALSSEVLVPIKRGEPVHWYQVQGIRALEKLSTAVRPRFRAVTVAVNESSSVGHWVRPNDSVDLLGTFRDPTRRDLAAVTLLQNITVLATGKTSANLQASDERTDYTNVTLLVLPQEAELIVLAQELGNLTLTLRNREDIGLLDERGRTTIETILNEGGLQKLEERRRSIIKIIRGLQQSR